MKQRAIMVFFLIAAFLMGCGNQNSGQQSAMQSVNVVQEAEAKSKNTEEAENEDEMQNVQTAYEGKIEDVKNAGDAEGIGDVKDIAETEKEDVEFLGCGNLQLQLCRIYHGAEQRDLTGSKGKELVQLISQYIDEGKDGWDGIAGVLPLENLEELGDIAKEKAEKYYILMQFDQPLQVSFEYGEERHGKKDAMKFDTDLYMFEVDPESGDNILHYTVGDKVADAKGLLSFYPVGGLGQEDEVGEFLRRYAEWEANE